MARRPKSASGDPFADLAKKMEILERELSAQREALARLKEMGNPPRAGRAVVEHTIRKTA